MANESDQTAPWTIKAVPVAVREKAVRYARMDGVTMAEWLTRAVQTEANRQDGDAVIGPRDAAPPPALSVDLGGVAAVLQAMAAAAAAGLPVTKVAVRETVTLVRDQVRAARGLPARQTRRAIGQTVSVDQEISALAAE